MHRAISYVDSSEELTPWNVKGKTRHICSEILAGGINLQTKTKTKNKNVEMIEGC